jgi:hypothetical protein
MSGAKLSDENTLADPGCVLPTSKFIPQYFVLERYDCGHFMLSLAQPRHGM